ncbi:hypothetical protein [Escherichia coli]|uniref:hypothetical protein n=1 Tax=Escherichia coli TaxID=562 RepID=UPI0018E438AE|nr:hypothetical protein [Escherichia coli]CAD5742635.1 Uncharacterised protein [Escherichia coli]
MTVNNMINNGFYAKSETFGGNGRRPPVIRTLQKLQIQEVCNNTPWETARQQLIQKPDGRYFAINSKHLAFPGSGESHAFCCIKNKNAIGINGNNAETHSTHYQPCPYDKISIWGPFPCDLT